MHGSGRQPACACRIASADIVHLEIELAMNPYCPTLLHRRQVCAAVVLVLGGPLALAQNKPALAFELVTPAEARRDLEVRAKNEAMGMEGTEAGRTRAMPAPAAGTPARPMLAIRVIAPTAQAAVKAPLRIELTFETPPGTRVVPSTFRVLYGVMKLDLTERLRRFATISERGVVVEQAVVPDGLHRLLLTVADDQGNVAEQELRLRVGVVS